MAKRAATPKMIRVSLVRSPIGRNPAQRKTVRALGLRKLNQTVDLAATPSVVGMVRRVSHLVDVQELS